MPKQSVLQLQQLKAKTREFAKAPFDKRVLPNISPLASRGSMKELVADLILSYQNRISAVDELLNTAYHTVSSNASFIELDKERERLTSSLRETLVKNCSLRRKDFNNLIEKVLCDPDKRRKEIEEEQKQVRERLKEYLDEQKKLASSLRQRLLEFTQGQVDKDSLGVIITDFKATYQDKGEQVLTMLRNFQSHLDIFQREQEEVNGRLQRLVDTGQSLTIEDLSKVEAVKARRERKADRELRRENVERLLLHFKEQRRGDSHRRRQ